MSIWRNVSGDLGKWWSYLVNYLRCSFLLQVHANTHSRPIVSTPAEVSLGRLKVRTVKKCLYFCMILHRFIYWCTTVVKTSILRTNSYLQNKKMRKSALWEDVRKEQSVLEESAQYVAKLGKTIVWPLLNICAWSKKEACCCHNSYILSKMLSWLSEEKLMAQA